MFDAIPLDDELEAAGSLGLPTCLRDKSSDIDLQRARGAARVVLGGSPNGTRIMDMYQQFPTRVMLPKINDGAFKEVVIINSSGGIAGGDQLDIEVIALRDTSVVVTSQAAEKVYR